MTTRGNRYETASVCEVALRSNLWEQGRQVVFNSGSMCGVKTPEKLFGITNCHVPMTYEKHKAEKPDTSARFTSSSRVEPRTTRFVRSTRTLMALLSLGSRRELPRTHRALRGETDQERIRE